MTKKQLTREQKTRAITKMVQKMNELNGCDYYQNLGIHYLNLQFVHSNFIIGGVIMDTNYNTNLSRAYDNMMFSHIPLRVWKTYFTFVFDVNNNRIINHKIHTFPYVENFNLSHESKSYIDELYPQIKDNQPILKFKFQYKLEFSGEYIMDYDMGETYLDIQDPYRVNRSSSSEYGYNFYTKHPIGFRMSRLPEEIKQEFISKVREKGLDTYYRSRSNYSCHCNNSEFITFEDEVHKICDGCIFHEVHYKVCKACSDYSRYTHYYIKENGCKYCNREERQKGTYSERDILEHLRVTGNNLNYMSHPNGGYSGGSFCLGDANGVLPNWTRGELNILEIILSIQANLSFSDRQSTDMYRAYKHKLPRSRLRNSSTNGFIRNMFRNENYQRSHSFSLYCYCDGCLAHKMQLYLEGKKYDSAFIDPKAYVISQEKAQALFDNNLTYVTDKRNITLTQEIINLPPEHFQP
jgi:hypothetical protein